MLRCVTAGKISVDVPYELSDNWEAPNVFWPLYKYRAVDCSDPNQEFSLLLQEKKYDTCHISKFPLRKLEASCFIFYFGSPRGNNMARLIVNISPISYVPVYR